MKLAAEAAYAHGSFWPMHDLLLEHQNALVDPRLFPLCSLWRRRGES